MAKIKESPSAKPAKKKGLESQLSGGGIDVKKIEHILSNLYSSFKTKIEDYLNKKYEEMGKKYERLEKSIDRYVQKLKQYQKQGVPEEKILKSPSMEHYKYALEYRAQLRGGMYVLKKADERLEEWFDKYGTPLAGLSGYLGRQKALKELGELKEESRNEFWKAVRDVLKKAPASAVLLAFAASIILAFSTSNITGFVIANKTIESIYPVSAGFVLLIISLILLLRKTRK